MKLKFSLKWCLLVFGLGISGIVGASKELDNYWWERPLLINSQTSAEVVVPLPFAVQQKMGEQGTANLTIVDRLNNFIPYDLFFEPAHKIKTGIKLISVSGSRPTEEAQNLIDDNALTGFKFPLKKPASVLLDLGTVYELHQVKFYTPAAHGIKKVSIFAGVNQERLSPVMKNKNWDTVIPFFNPITARFIQLEFQGNKFLIDDIQWHSLPQVSLVFEAEARNSYRLYYGLEGKYLLFDRKLSALPKKNLLPATLGKESMNPRLSSDWDQDKVKNSADNCPFIKNPNQKDTDQDRVGDVCDNAPLNKNYNQLDTDFDAVGDIIDNCKSVPNPSQVNLDQDQYGDACDRQVTAQQWQSWLYAVGIVATLAILAGGAHRYFPRKKFKEILKKFQK